MFTKSLDKDVLLDVARRRQSQLGALRHIRPAALASALRGLLDPDDRRAIIPSKDGLLFFADVFSNLGRELLRKGEYEPQTRSNLEKLLGPGHTFLDLGANEGYFSVAASKLVGEQGRVISVEPQGRLQSIILINAALNLADNVEIEHAAIANAHEVELNIWPSSNTGASSMVRKYAWSRRTEKVRATTIHELLTKRGITRVEVMKCDVEGAEIHIIPMLLDSLRCGSFSVEHVLIDYHESILKSSRQSAEGLHRLMLEGGGEVAEGSATGGYVHYRFK